MTKLILNNLKDKQNLNQEKSLTGIGTEESYNNCCVVDHKYANVLSTIYEMIEKNVLEQQKLRQIRNILLSNLL